MFPLSMLCILALSAGCGEVADKTTLVLPLTSGDVSPPTYIKYIDSAVIDSTHIALVWVDESDSGNRVWTSTVRRNEAGELEADSPTTLVDRDRIMDAHAFAEGTSYGVLYTKELQLLCRRPLSAAPSLPFAPSSPTLQASSAYVDQNGTLYIIGFLLRSVPDLEYVCFALATANDSTQLKILGQLRMPRLRQQPTPQLYPVGDSLGVALLLSWGSYTSRSAPFDSVGKASGEAGALVLLRLFLDQDHALQAVPLAAATLPEDADLAFARSFVLLDPLGRQAAVSATRAYLLSPFDSAATLQGVSSMTGSGANYARPRIQAIGLRDSAQLLLWIDASSGVDLSNIAAGVEPSQFGGDILASKVSNGKLVGAEVTGFPIVTQAQCMTLQRLGGSPVLAWARASNAWHDTRRLPDGICVRMLTGFESP